MSPAVKPGKVYLIGAGPGDPELLTLKAVRALSSCQVVLYDRLVSPEVLAYAAKDAELIYVGKREGEQEATQARIFDLLLQHSSEGRTVARLKGGDPLVFGRGAEEWVEALEHGIEVELIPGISSAVAVPGLAGIPLTHRTISRSFAVVTGHCRIDVDDYWRRYAAVDTLVVLMGVQNRESIAQALLRAGRERREPVAFVENGSTAKMHVVEGTLGQVADGKVQVHNPAVFVVGHVVRLRSTLTGSQVLPDSAAPKLPPC